MYADSSNEILSNDSKANNIVTLTMTLTAYDTVSKTHVNFLSLVYSCRGRFSQFEDEFQIWSPCATFRDNYGQIWVISYIFVHFA